jgi:hypothetical protein
MDGIRASGDTAGEVRRILLNLARREYDLAATEAASQPYWRACPPSIQGHRAAAAALREEADRLLGAAQPVASQVWTS